MVARRRADWERLDALVRRSSARRAAPLSADELIELGRLYQRVVADLAVARRDAPGDRLVLYLNQLVARAHAVVYRSEAGEWRGVFRFFGRGFPELFRQTLPFTAAACAVFVLTAVAGFLAALYLPDSRPYLVPANVLGAVQEQRMWTENISLPSSLLASVIMSNNIRVALLAFAGGILFGVLTFYVLALNGLSIGAVAGVCQAYGLSLRLWSFVAPHGVIELSVIFIAGGAGLRLGHALLRPGLHTRGESLRRATVQVVRLLFGCVPLLVIAGTIEGFISPSPLSPFAKLAIGGLSAVLLFGYLFFAGRSPARCASASSIPGTD